MANLTFYFLMKKYCALKQNNTSTNNIEEENIIHKDTESSYKVWIYYQWIRLSMGSRIATYLSVSVGLSMFSVLFLVILKQTVTSGSQRRPSMRQQKPSNLSATSMEPFKMPVML